MWKFLVQHLLMQWIYTWKIHFQMVPGLCLREYLVSSLCIHCVLWFMKVDSGSEMNTLVIFGEIRSHSLCSLHLELHCTWFFIPYPKSVRMNISFWWLSVWLESSRLCAMTARSMYLLESCDTVTNKVKELRERLDRISALCIQHYWCIWQEMMEFCYSIVDWCLSKHSIHFSRVHEW